MASGTTAKVSPEVGAHMTTDMSVTQKALEHENRELRLASGRHTGFIGPGARPFTATAPLASM